jgi:hypothetical protein
MARVPDLPEIGASATVVLSAAQLAGGGGRPRRDRRLGTHAKPHHHCIRLAPAARRCATPPDQAAHVARDRVPSPGLALRKGRRRGPGCARGVPGQTLAATELEIAHEKDASTGVGSTLASSTACLGQRRVNARLLDGMPRPASDQRSPLNGVPRPASDQRSPPRRHASARVGSTLAPSVACLGQRRMNALLLDDVPRPASDERSPVIQKPRARLDARAVEDREGSLGVRGSTDRSPDTDFGVRGSTDRSPDTDFGVRGSTDRSPDTDFGVPRTHDCSPDADFGVRGSTDRSPDTDFGSSRAHDRSPGDAAGFSRAHDRSPGGARAGATWSAG